MKDQVIKQIKEKHISSGGKCGVKLIDFGISIKKLKPILNQLYKDDLITVHDNHHGKLVMLKKSLELI